MGPRRARGVPRGWGWGALLGAWVLCVRVRLRCVCALVHCVAPSRICARRLIDFFNYSQNNRLLNSYTNDPISSKASKDLASSYLHKFFMLVLFCRISAFYYILCFASIQYALDLRSVFWRDGFHFCADFLCWLLAYCIS